MQPTYHRDQKFLCDLQQFLARYSTTGSFGRIAGSAGNQGAARKYLANLNLCRFTIVDEDGFAKALDEATEELERAMPKPIWGFARKGMNIFLRDCFYNKYIHDHYRLKVVGPLLEVPLDHYVAQGIQEDIRRSEGTSLGWESIRKLDRCTSKALQEGASRIAARKQLLRVHLDLKWWGGER